jgi:hypothetical protein
MDLIIVAFITSQAFQKDTSTDAFMTAVWKKLEKYM